MMGNIYFAVWCEVLSSLCDKDIELYHHRVLAITWHQSNWSFGGIIWTRHFTLLSPVFAYSALKLFPIARKLVCLPMQQSVCCNNACYDLSFLYHQKFLR
jgi:hypothetical protein